MDTYCISNAQPALIWFPCITILNINKNFIANWELMYQKVGFSVHSVMQVGIEIVSTSFRLKERWVEGEYQLNMNYSEFWKSSKYGMATCRKMRIGLKQFVQYLERSSFFSLYVVTALFNLYFWLKDLVVNSLKQLYRLCVGKLES